MISGAEGIGGGAAAYFASLAQSVSSISPARSLSGGEGAGGLSGGEGGGNLTGGEGGPAASVSISGIGQLLSALQQLQTQSPTQFSQVVAQISSQLGNAAQQQGKTGQSKALSDLATQFQDLASTGDLSQLDLGNSTTNSGGSVYGNYGQLTGFSSRTNSPFEQLFANLASEVDSALSN